MPLSYATIIHTCRSTGVDIMLLTIMISKRRLSYRLPKTMLHSQLGDTGSLSRGRHERNVPEILWSQTSVFPMQTPYLAKLQTNLNLRYFA